MLPGATGIRFVAPPHQLHAQADHTLPLEPVDLRLSAAFDTDFGSWTDLSVGVRQRLPLRRGELQLGVRGANLIGSQAAVLLDARDDRFVVVGRQLGRRVEVDVSWSF